jgi:mannose-1-phosphate guanylyltransferase/phosphomannomutase
MKAVIMAGGEGTRLRPLTSNQPKPMLPMANVPMMEHVVNLLRQHGFEEIVVTVAFMANAIRTYFGDGSEFGVRMVYATESTPLGTAGSVRNARDELDERFLVLSGDVLTDIDLAQVVAFHEERGGMATLALKAVDNPLEFGIVITREDGSIERFLEKPTWGQVFSDTINTGIYVLEPEIFDFIPEGVPVDFSGDSFPSALAAGEPLYGYVADGYWEDVGTLEAYLGAHQDILDQRVQVDINGFQLRHRRQLRDRTGGPARPVLHPGPQRPGRRQCRAPTLGGPRQQLFGLRGSHRRQRSRARVGPPRRGPLRRGSRPG